MSRSISTLCNTASPAATGTGLASSPLLTQCCGKDTASSANTSARLSPATLAPQPPQCACACSASSGRRPQDLVGICWAAARSAHKLAINAVFPAPHPGSLGTKGPFIRRRPLAPQGNQGQKALLRFMLAQRLDPARQRAGCVPEPAPAAPRKLRPWASGGLAESQYLQPQTPVGSSSDCKVSLHREKALFIRLQATGGHPGCRRGAGTPEQIIENTALTTVQDQGVALYRATRAPRCTCTPWSSSAPSPLPALFCCNFCRISLRRTTAQRAQLPR